MVSNGLPDPKNRPDNLSDHEFGVTLAQQVLSEIHPPGSYDLHVETQGSTTVIIATDNPIYAAERRAVRVDLETIDEILKVGEKRPRLGTLVDLTIAGRQVQMRYKGIADIVEYARIGITTVTGAYSLIAPENERIAAFNKRIESLEGIP